MNDDPNLDSMNALERLRYLAKLAADSGKAAAAVATARAEMSAAVLQAGARLFELRNGELAWIGKPMENVLADGGSEDCEDDAPDSWLVNIEADLLARVRAQDFDLDELLDQHRKELDDTECLCVATPAKLPDGEWFAIMTRAKQFHRLAPRPQGEVTEPHRRWRAAATAQVARNLTDRGDGALRDSRFLLIDRDTKFTGQFRRILEDAGVEVVKTAFQAPNMNAIAERFVQTVKRECLERLILFGADHLRQALKEFVAHYHIERPHQGLGNKVLTASASEQPRDGDVVVDERLGGLLRSYRRTA